MRDLRKEKEKKKVGKCYSCVSRDFLASPEFFGRRAVRFCGGREVKVSQPLLFRWQSNSERATVQSCLNDPSRNIFVSVCCLFVQIVGCNSVQVSGNFLLFSRDSVRG